MAVGVAEAAVPVIRTQGLSKIYSAGTEAEVAALRGVDLVIDRGEFVAIMGPSGSGKSTLMNLIGCLDTPTAGKYFCDGVDVSTLDKEALATLRRDKIGFVFQGFHLLTRMDATDNVAMPLGYARIPPAQRKELARAALASVGLAERAGHRPNELSGGQQQRVALARALAPRPELILLDEPFSNLDVDLRERLSFEVRAILKQEGMTAILVTHDQHEAFAMADEIGVMADGKIQQWDTPYNLYHRPANRFVADFVGQGVFLPGTVIDSHRVDVELGRLQSRLPLECMKGCAECGRGCRVEVLLRPDDVVHDDQSPTQAEILHRAFRGAEFLYTLRLASGAEVLSLVPSHHDHAIGERIGIRLDVDHVVAFRNTALPR